VFTVVPVFVALIFPLMVALATKVNSSWIGLTLITLCPIILPFSTKNGFPNEVLLSITCAVAVCIDIAVPPVANIPTVIKTASDITFKNNLILTDNTAFSYGAMAPVAIFVHTAHPLQTFFCFISCSASVSLSLAGGKGWAYTNGVTTAVDDSKPTASTNAIAMVFLLIVLFLKFVVIFGLGRLYTSYFKVIYPIITRCKHCHHSNKRKNKWIIFTAYGIGIMYF
jgi:hypothetical protein